MTNETNFEIPKLVMDILRDDLDSGEFWVYDIEASRKEGETWEQIVSFYSTGGCADCAASVKEQGFGGCHCGKHTPWPGLAELG